MESRFTALMLSSVTVRSRQSQERGIKPIIRIVLPQAEKIGATALAWSKPIAGGQPEQRPSPPAAFPATTPAFDHRTVSRKHTMLIIGNRVSKASFAPNKIWVEGE